jgi:hypothetical protein
MSRASRFRRSSQGSQTTTRCNRTARSGSFPATVNQLASHLVFDRSKSRSTERWTVSTTLDAASAADSSLSTTTRFGVFGRRWLRGAAVVRMLSGVGCTRVVSTTVGDQKGWSDCVVARQQVRNVQPRRIAAAQRENEVLLSLNCDAPEASVTSAGHSAASPEGRAAAAASATPTPGS